MNSHKDNVKKQMGLKAESVSNPKYTIHQLPELPLEALGLGGKLVHAGTEPILTIRPEKAIVPEQPNPLAAALSKSETFLRKYLAYVTYPRVVCYPLSELFELTLKEVFQSHHEPLKANEADPEAIARHKQFYKLTSHKGVKLNSPHFCTVHYGPWSAIVFERESCFEGVPHEWTLFIVEMPEVELTWFGFWKDIPAYLYPSLHVIMGTLSQLSESHECCTGYKWCATTNSCIPVTVECNSSFPA